MTHITNKPKNVPMINQSASAPLADMDASDLFKINRALFDAEVTALLESAAAIERGRLEHLASSKTARGIATPQTSTQPRNGCLASESESEYVASDGVSLKRIAAAQLDRSWKRPKENNDAASVNATASPITRTDVSLYHPAPSIETESCLPQEIDTRPSSVFTRMNSHIHPSRRAYVEHPNTESLEELPFDPSPDYTQQRSEAQATTPAVEEGQITALLRGKDLTRVQTLTVEDVKLLVRLIGFESKVKGAPTVIHAYQNGTLEDLIVVYKASSLSRISTFLRGKDLTRVGSLTAEEVNLVTQIATLGPKTKGTPGAIQAYQNGTLQDTAPASRTHASTSAASKTYKPYVVNARSFLRNKVQWDTEWKLSEQQVTRWQLRLDGCQLESDAKIIYQEIRGALLAKLRARGSTRPVSVIAGDKPRQREPHVRQIYDGGLKELKERAQVQRALFATTSNFYPEAETTGRSGPEMFRVMLGKHLCTVGQNGKIAKYAARLVRMYGRFKRPQADHVRLITVDGTYLTSEDIPRSVGPARGGKNTKIAGEEEAAARTGNENVDGQATAPLTVRMAVGEQCDAEKSMLYEGSLVQDATSSASGIEGLSKAFECFRDSCPNVDPAAASWRAAEAMRKHYEPDLFDIPSAPSVLVTTSQPPTGQVEQAFTWAPSSAGASPSPSESDADGCGGEISVAEKMMAKMGYREGSGLGKESQATVDPIEAKLRPEKLGLGAVKKQRKARRERVGNSQDGVGNGIVTE